ncbi:MAG: class I SAM-dependent methyltransferase [Candidatus Sungbacteria bacterium]|nr:class I SAM-dependent methyltransferase [Candidatus Sungbacteria bacterium]
MNKTKKPDMFRFGRNWDNYDRMYSNRGRIDEAKSSLTRFLNKESLKGLSFLDIGSGSGIFSLAAFELGATVVSFDIDNDSVLVTERVWKMAGAPSNWKVFHGSILDEKFIRSLGEFDIVYSWGVLHHTGSMWQAIKNAASLVRQGGLLHIAIYNKSEGWGLHPDGRLFPSKFWLWEKRFYSRLPWFLQNIIDWFLMAILVLGYLITFQNPITKIRGHIRYRGMSWRIDIKDWLGGYPYEFASAGEIFRFVKPLSFVLENLNTNDGLLNNEFLFKKI